MDFLTTVKFPGLCKAKDNRITSIKPILFIYAARIIYTISVYGQDPVYLLCFRGVQVSRSGWKVSTYTNTLHSTAL
jgi:hypothetical protein